MEELEKKKPRRHVNLKHLNEILEYRKQLSKFTPEQELLKEETSKLLREYDGLHDEVDAGVEAVLAYDESLKDDEALQFLKVRATFWEVFKERQDAASAAAKSAEAQQKEIEDERAVIRSRMETTSNRISSNALRSPAPPIPGLWLPWRRTCENYQRYSFNRETCTTRRGSKSSKV